MSALHTLQNVANLVCVLTLVQSFEYLLLAKATGDHGVWRWDDVEHELAGTKKTLRLVLSGFLSGDHFLYVNTFRIVLASSFFVYPLPLTLVLLLILHSLTLLRWFGSFNGGSDFMSLRLLAATSIGLLFEGAIPRACLWFIGIQVCFTYFLSGLAKLKNPEWRNGTALLAFINSPIYEQNSLCSFVSRSPRFVSLLSLLVILFEITFPLSLIRPEMAITYIVAGLGFHIANAYIFGLNRFIYAWLPTYPALLFCSLPTLH